MTSNRIATTLFSVLLLAGLSGAEVPPLDALPNPELGSIGVSLTVKLQTMARMDWWPATRIYFARLDDRADGILAGQVIASNWSDSKQVYLLIAEPGRYVAVGATIKAREFSNTLVIDLSTVTSTVEMESGPRYEYDVFFPEDMVAETEVVVEAGNIAFMGHLRARPDSGPPDRAQSHYLPIAFPELANERIVEVTSVTLKDVARDEKTERAFWAKAQKKAFRNNPEWNDLVVAQLESSGKD